MQRSRVLVLVAALSVLSWWIIGYLPWLVSGLRFTADSGHLGSAGEGTAGVVMPLPMVAGALPELVAGAVVGGVVAGLLPIAVTHVPRPLAILVVWLVVLVSGALAVAISARQVRAAAHGYFASDTRVLAGLGAAFAAALVVGLIAGSLSVHWHPLAAIAAALVAGTMRTWVAAFVPQGRLSPDTISWIAAVLLALILGAGLAVSVHRTARAVLAWPVALAVLWLTGPALTAVAYLTALLRPSSGLPGSLGEHLHAARQVFGQAIGHTHPSFLAVAVALLAGVASLVKHHRPPVAGEDPGNLQV